MILRKGYGILKRLTKPFRHKICIFTTFKCTLDCNYCTLKMYNGQMPCSSTLTVDEWMDRVKTFPLPLREVVISGGEPTIYDGYADLVNRLLDAGYYVVVNSNLTVFRDDVNPSHRFRILATYHHSANRIRWEKNYRAYSKKYRVDAVEIGQSDLDYTRTKEFCKVEEAKTYSPGFYYGPDGILNTSFWEVLQRYEKV